MAEETPQEDRTEEPTARRMEKARDEGQVLRSQDLTVAILTIGLMGSLYALRGFIGPNLAELFRSSLTIKVTAIQNANVLVHSLGSYTLETFLYLSPLFAIAVLFAIGGATSLDGFVLSAKAVAPKISKLDPLKGLARIFGTKALMELVKSLTKFLLVAAVASIYLFTNYDKIIAMGTGDVRTSIVEGLSFVLLGGLIICSALLLIAAIDVPYQRFEFLKKLRMTKQEIKDEFKEIEGQPEVRQRIKQKQREIADQRMLDDVPKADVIITNPQHFAIALSYDPSSSSAPIVVAKGKGFTAQKIKEIGDESGVHQFESPVLARALYFTTDIGSFIPQKLYVAVAQVIAYIYSLKDENSDVALHKPKPRIPSELVFDELGHAQD
mgnify:FL=1